MRSASGTAYAHPAGTYRPLGARLALLCVTLGLLWANIAAAELPAGKARHEADLDGVRLTFLSYKPTGYEGGPLIMAFHGSDRRPAVQRDALIPLAESSKVIVVAPRFDEERFPRWAYQLGGIAERIEQDERVTFRERPPEDWTGTIVLKLVEYIRREEERPDLPYYLIGHSGGAQFLGRFAAFVPNEARRIVLANPGTYLFPDPNRSFPYGFGDLSAALSSDEQVRRYLAVPVTILLGTEDLLRDLPKRRGAERQGLSRYERGVNAFSAAREIAAEHGWTLNWRLVEVPGVGHSSREMYGGPEALVALFGDEGPSYGAGCARPAPLEDGRHPGSDPPRGDTADSARHASC